MTLLPEITRNYLTNSAEGIIYDRLNELTYNHNKQTLEGSFVSGDPLTFELFHPNEARFGGRPFATKVTVTICRNDSKNSIIARTTTNPANIVIVILITISFLIQIISHPSFIPAIGFLLALSIFIVWDRVVKMITLKRLENILPEIYRSLQHDIGEIGPHVSKRRRKDVKADKEEINK